MSDRITLPASWQGWEITENIGQGSYGSVYRARFFGSDEKTPEKASAIKIIRIPYDETEEAAIAHEYADISTRRTFYQGIVDSLLSEISTMEKIKENPNAVALQDYYVESDEDGLKWSIYIRMELLTPFSEYEILEELGEEDVIRLGIDICNVLEACSEQGLIHRDIKPENIMVDENGQFKLGDFGIARELEATTRGMSLKGTFSYMAPEVFHGEKYDERADQYSLGIVLYRLMNNNRDPLVSPDAQMVSLKEREEALQKRMEGEALPDPSEASELFGKIIRKACAYRPENRFDQISDLKKALESLLLGETYSVPGLVEISENEQRQLEKRSQKRRKILIIIVIAAAAAAVLGIAAYYQTRKTEDEIHIEESRRIEREIEATDGTRKDNALKELDISGAAALQDDLNDSEVNRNAEEILSEILRFEAEAREQNANDRQKYDSCTERIFWQEEDSALGFSVNYKSVTDNDSNTEQIRSLFTLYYLTRTDSGWTRSPNVGIPEETWESFFENCLPKGYYDAYIAGRNCISFPESWWVGAEAVYENAAALRAAALWQNADGSVDAYLICRNGTDMAAAEYAWWLVFSDETSGEILKNWGRQEPGTVTVAEHSAAGYIIHFEAEEVLSGTAEWDRNTAVVYTAGNNSNYES